MGAKAKRWAVCVQLSALLGSAPHGVQQRVKKWSLRITHRGPTVFLLVLNVHLHNDSRELVPGYIMSIYL